MFLSPTGTWKLLVTSSTFFSTKSYTQILTILPMLAKLRLSLPHNLLFYKDTTLA